MVLDEIFPSKSDHRSRDWAFIRTASKASKLKKRGRRGGSKLGKARRDGQQISSFQFSVEKTELPIIGCLFLSQMPKPCTAGHDGAEHEGALFRHRRQRR